MTSRTQVLSRLAFFGGVALTISGCAQPQPPSAAAVSEAFTSPQTGSSQGVNTHNSEPMPSGMVMKNNGLAPGTSMSTDPSSTPQTGSQQGLNTHNSEPMPSGMRMRNSGVSPGSPMTFQPQPCAANGFKPGREHPQLRADAKWHGDAEGTRHILRLAASDQN